MRFVLLTCVLFLIIISSCKKMDIQGIWDCNKEQKLDSAGIAIKLTGAWAWEKKACKNGRAKKGKKEVKAIFNANATFTVNDGSGVLAQGTWQLKRVNSDLWGVDLSTPVEYLIGAILFCDNQVLFYDSFRDGCDHLFVRE